jgi:cell division initiation protein
MAFTPVEIRHVRPARNLFGYRRAAVEALLEQIAEDFEIVWRERADLADRVEVLEGDLVRYKEGENLLRATLVSAERAANELKEQARREAELILTEAHAAARAVTRRAASERERYLVESRQLRARLATVLATLDEEEDEGEAEASESRKVEAA